MMNLTEFITKFKLAVSDNDWQQVASLDESLQAVVEAASLDLDSDSSGREGKIKQFEDSVKKLNDLYAIASKAAISERDALAITIAEASKAKVGTDCYQKMQQHS